MTERPSHAYRDVCPYCARVQKGATLAARHVAQCPQNPTVAWRLIAFLREHADNGAIMPIHEFQELCTRGRLPTQRVIKEVLGNWRQVALWAGLQYRSANRAGRHHAPPGLVTVEEIAASLPTGYGHGRVVGTWDCSSGKVVYAKR